MRGRGCTILFRGDALNSIDVQNILAVFEPDAGEVWPPGYVEHDANRTYFYLVRGINSCGYSEWGLQAIARVSIEAEGRLSKPRPNGVLGLKAERTADKKVRLNWYYCPIEQEAEPDSFNLFGDGGSGQTDYDNAIGTIRYEGKGFYSYTSDELSEGRKSFAVKAASKEGMEGSVSVVEIEADFHIIELLLICKAEAF
jgi:hypothetical protein